MTPEALRQEARTPESAVGFLPEAASAPRKAAALPPQPPVRAASSDASVPPVWEPRRRQPEPEPSHAARNFILALMAFVLVGAILFAAYKQYGTGHLSSAPANPPSSAASPEPAPPPPQPAPAEPAPAEPAPPPPEPAPVEAKTGSPAPNPEPDPEPKQARRVPAPTDGMFQLTATPAGATAVFDKSAALKCVTPCSLSLATGRHTFVVQFPGYRDAQRIIDIPHDTGLIVNLEKMSGLLTVSTNPTGLTIVIDGQLQARKSPATFVLLPGPHTVEIVRGSERHPLSVDIQDGSTIERHIDLSQ